MWCRNAAMPSHRKINITHIPMRNNAHNTLNSFFLNILLIGRFRMGFQQCGIQWRICLCLRTKATAVHLKSSMHAVPVYCAIAGHLAFVMLCWLREISHRLWVAISFSLSPCVFSCSIANEMDFTHLAKRVTDESLKCLLCALHRKQMFVVYVVYEWACVGSGHSISDPQHCVRVTLWICACLTRTNNTVHPRSRCYTFWMNILRWMKRWT